MICILVASCLIAVVLEIRGLTLDCCKGKRPLQCITAPTASHQRRRLSYKIWLFMSPFNFCPFTGWGLHGLKTTFQHFLLCLIDAEIVCFNAVLGVFIITLHCDIFIPPFPPRKHGSICFLCRVCVGQQWGVDQQSVISRVTPGCRCGGALLCSGHPQVPSGKSLVHAMHLLNWILHFQRLPAGNLSSSPRINYSLIITQTLWIREQGGGLAGVGEKMEQFGLQLVFHFFPYSLFA